MKEDKEKEKKGLEGEFLLAHGLSILNSCPHLRLVFV